MARKSLRTVAKLLDTAKTGIPPEQNFIADLKASIEKDAEKGSRKPSIYYKPSSMNCIRSMYYMRLGKPVDEEGTSYVNIGICNSGTDIHERVQKAVANMVKNGYDCDYVNVGDYVKSRNLNDIDVISQQGMETKLFNKALNLSFLCDGIIKYKNTYYILELKTESSRKWFAREGVAEEHYKQATAYSLSLGIDSVIFVYINRDIFDFKSFLFNPSEEMKQDLVGLIENCEGYVKRQITPPKPDDIAKKTCEYCGYKTLCRKEI